MSTLGVIFVLFLLVAVAAVGLLRGRPPGSRLPEFRLPGLPGPRPPARRPSESEGPMSEDALRTLGLSEVRPRTAEGRTSESTPGRDEAIRTLDSKAEEREARTPSAPAERAAEQTTTVSRPRRSGAFIRTASPLWAGRDARGVGHLLDSLSAALGGTAALLRYVGADDAYAVDALAGGATVAAPAPLPAAGSALHRVPQSRRVTTLAREDAAALAYHASPSEAVGQALVRAVAPPPAARLLLVADAPPGAAPLGARGEALLNRYADLLADLLGLALSPAEGPDEAVAPRLDRGNSADAWIESMAEDEAADRLPPDDDWTDEDLEAVVAEVAGSPDEAWGGAASETAEASDEPVRPRSRLALIADHMDAARRSGFPLAFALVALQDAEVLLDQGEAATSRAEAGLIARLEGVAGTREVETFGDLLVGAFCEADEDGVAEWAAEVAAAGDPVFIGVALLGDHEAPDALRDEAAGALHEAYASGEACVIA